MNQYEQYGGQAVIEGVMMRSPRFFAVACRKPDGEIVVRTEPVENSIVGRLKWLNKPFLRGTLALIDAMALGTRALTFAAQVQAEAIAPAAEAPVSESAPAVGGNATQATAQAAVEGHGRINDIAIGATLVFAVLVGLGIFVALPTLLVQPYQRHLTEGGRMALSYGRQVSLNALDGLVRITIFLVYIGLIARMQNIRRVFEYHGAEHKTINTLEAGQEIRLENCLLNSRIHPRCGTSFIIVVLLASILVHSLFPRPENYFVRLALHLSLVPVVAGLAYEVIRLAGKFRSAAVLRTLLAPGLWSQRLTTREPDSSQVEVAMAALTAVIEREQGIAEPAPIAAVG